MGFVRFTLFSLDNKDLSFIQNLTNPPDKPSNTRRKQKLEPRLDYEPFAIRNILTLVDSGNHFGDAISDRLAVALKIRVSPTRIKKTPLATRSATCTVLGRAKYPIAIKFNENIYYFQPFVIKNLSTPINLSSYFMMQHGAGVDCKQRKFTIEDEQVPLRTVKETVHGLFAVQMEMDNKDNDFLERQAHVLNDGQEEVPVTPSENKEENKEEKKIHKKEYFRSRKTYVQEEQRKRM